MSGNTLFRPEDRLAWYADWLKFLQEREAELRTQLARQEKSARKVEAPPEAGIAFVSDQAQGASFLAIAFGEQVAADEALPAQPPVDEAGSGGSMVGTVCDGDDGEAPDDAEVVVAAVASAKAASDDEPPAVEEELVPPSEGNAQLADAPVPLSPSLPVSGSPTPPLSPSPTATEPPPKEDLA